MDAATLRRATGAAQAVLREADPTMVIDGKPGTFTLKVYKDASPQLREAVDRLVIALGVPGGLVALNDAYTKALSTGATPVDRASAIFDLQVVPAMVREARRRGIDPLGPIAQVAVESGWGRRTPLKADGTPSYNYGGLKANAVKNGKAPVMAASPEYRKGAFVTETSAFASFDSADDFAKSFFAYTLDGPSSYRYKQWGADKAQSPEQWAQALARGGYATDPGYAGKLVAVARTAAAKYGLTA